MNKQPKQHKTIDLQEGQIIDAKIEYQGEKGDGVIKIDGFVVMVKRAEVGKRYKIRINKIYSTYAFALIINEIKEEEQEGI